MRIAILLLLTLARTLSACSCAGEMHQSLLDRAQFVAEVTAVSATEFAVDRVVRGAKDTRGRIFVVANPMPQPRDCCDRTPHAIAINEKYWVIAPDQPVVSGKRVRADGIAILQHSDGRATYLAHVHDLTPAQLRSLLQRWKAGAMSPRDFSKVIDAVDVPSVSACSRGYYHRLLMDLTYMAWGNEDHSQCAPEVARRVRAESASAALATLSFIEIGGREARLVCARDTSSAQALTDLVERQVRETKQLYPCIDSRTREALADDELDALTAAMQSYFNQIHGFGSNGFVLLYYTSVQPERRQLDVAVFSPANEEASRRYASPEVKSLVADLIARNRRSAQIPALLPRVQLTSHHLLECGDEPVAANMVDAFAFSRPGFAGDKALVYLEYRGGARAYNLVRRNGHFETDWYVDLWQCG